MNFITDDTTVSEVRKAFRERNASFRCTAATDGISVVLTTCDGDSLGVEGADLANVLDHALQMARVAYIRKEVGALLREAANRSPGASKDPSGVKGLILDAIGMLTK